MSERGEVTVNALNDWFRKIGTGLSNEDYEAGITALAQHEAAIRRDQIMKDAQIAKEYAEEAREYRDNGEKEAADERGHRS